MLVNFLYFTFLTFAIVLFFICYFKEEKKITRNIAVYSGSFNPLHIGHKAIIEDLCKKYIWVYLIVTPKNPLKDNISEKDIDERLEKAQNALFKHGLYNVTVSDIEKNMLPPYYTIRTLDKLKENEPNNNFSLVIGADNLRQLKEWNNYKRLLTDYGVIVYPRGVDDVEVLYNLKKEYLSENSNYKIEIVNTIIPNISSTEIRNAIKHGDNVDNLLM